MATPAKPPQAPMGRVLLWLSLGQDQADSQGSQDHSGCHPGNMGSGAISQPFPRGLLDKPPSHLVGCNLLKRSLITGVPLNMRPRYKDFTLLATLKGTQGRMSCGNGSASGRGTPWVSSSSGTEGPAWTQAQPCVLPLTLPSEGPGTHTGSAWRQGSIPAKTPQDSMRAHLPCGAPR